MTPIAQDPAYDNFADDRRMLGIPNLLNVISNVPFIAVGGLGMLSLLHRGSGEVCSLFAEPCADLCHRKARDQAHPQTPDCCAGDILDPPYAKEPTADRTSPT